MPSAHRFSIQVTRLLLGAGCSLFAACTQGVAEDDQRPAFDKSDHVGTVWTHVNSWKTETYAQEPLNVDRALQNSMGDPVQDYARTAHLLEKYGIDGIYLQAAREQFSLNNALSGFDKAGNDRKVAYFLGHGTFRPGAARINQIDDPDERARRIVETMAAWLEKNRKWFLDHPNFHRVDGHPVIVLWGFGGLQMTPGLWARVLPEIEERAYRCIWLKHDHFWRRDTLEDWIPVMDGATQYAAGHHNLNLKGIAGPMKRKWPDKIFEGNAGPLHQSLLQGQTGYDMGRLTAKWREALEFAIRLKPDSLHLTNWNDVEENSHIFPSYLRRDTLLRLFDVMTREWRGKPAYAGDAPELILSQKIDVMAGEPLDLEVVALPVGADKPSAIELHLSLVNAAGESLHQFPVRNIQADTVAAARFRTASLPLAGEPVVYPSLTYHWNDREFGPFRLRPTRLWIGQKPTDLAWMTPLDEWAGELAADWKIRRPGETDSEAAKPGDTIVAEPRDGTLCHVLRTIPEAEQGRETEYRLLLNGTPAATLPPRRSFFRKDATSILYNHRDPAPWSWLGLEAKAFDFVTVPYGERGFTVRQKETVWNSRAIHTHRGGRWEEPVTVPVAIRDFDSEAEKKAEEGPNWLRNIPYEKIGTVTVPRYRVPFWHYRIDENEGGLFRDSSGYQHHGWLGTHGRNSYNNFGPFGFRFSHRFPNARSPIEGRDKLNQRAPAFQRDGDGSGFLRFDGNDDFVMLPPRTRMPLAGTHEVRVRGEATGDTQTILGPFSSPYFDGLGHAHPFRLNLDPEGRPEFVLLPKTNQTRRIRADAPLEPGEWTHIAIVYDLEEWHLYIDGRQVGEALPFHPRGELQVGTHMLLGMLPRAKAETRQLDKPRFRLDPFAGDLSAFRATGRPLDPDEFLPEGP